MTVTNETLRFRLRDEGLHVWRGRPAQHEHPVLGVILTVEELQQLLDNYSVVAPSARIVEY